MPLATLKEVLDPALANGHAVAGLVVLGWEDARAYAMAAQAEGVPLILQAGPGCRAHTPLPVLAAMFRTLAADVDVPLVAHLDHGYAADECREAIETGFTAVMYDGSRKPLSQNIEETSAIVEMAREAGVCVEGEVGFVGYADGGDVAGEASARSDPDEVAQFVTMTGVDAVAVSVGNVHLQQS
ncbi:MAG: class II fructose-bisphosphate aldolase, partial [Pseudomonadota bacterium]